MIVEGVGRVTLGGGASLHSITRTAHDPGVIRVHSVDFYTPRGPDIGLYRDNGKEHGSYLGFSVLFQAYIQKQCQSL